MHGLPVLRGLTIGDAPDAWRRAGFAVDGARFAVDGITVRLLGDEGPRGIVSWELEHPNPRSVDGLVHDDVGEPGRPTEHPNGATLVDHVVVGSSDVERTTSALAELGVRPRRTAEGLGPGRDRLYRFFLLGTCVLELIGPLDPDPSAGPAGFWGLAFVTTDVDLLAARLGETAGEPHDAVQPGRRIVSLRHEAIGLSVPTAFLTPRH